MGYSDNPFNSAKGQELMKNIFNLMFIPPPNSPSKIESNDKDRQVAHYKGNIVNIVNKMRKFVKGYQQVIISETASSGIHVCPSCQRRDAIWMWETVDAGHYSSLNEWLSSVRLTKWDFGLDNEKGRYHFVVRYRCNNVTTCEKCHISVGGHHNSCKSCGNSGVVKVGCGEESYANHFIREYTADQNHPQEKNNMQGSVDANRQVPNPNDRRDRSLVGDISGYRFHHRMIPDGKVVKDWSEIKKYLPYVEFTYTHFNTGFSVERNYPVSELNYAISKQNMVQCFMGQRNANGVNYHPGNLYQLDNYGEPIEACPMCQATDFPPLQEVQNQYYKPHPMKIMNPQPLEAATSVGGTFKGKPVYTLYLESPVADSFKLILPLPQIMNLNPIPNEAKPSLLASSSTSCPNDVGAGVAETDAIDEANEKMREEQEELLKDLTKGTDGETNKGFTFVVCEGRSRKAYYDNDLSKWIDDSPPCKSFRKDGATLTKSREYPRWSEIPSYSPEAIPNTHYTEYLGPNPDTHFVMDWIKCNQTLNNYAIAPPCYHTVVGIAENIDEEMGLIYEVFECKTCKNIVEAGGIIPYREARQQCDKDGKSINDFPQNVLDAEIEFEKNYPVENTKGEPVKTAWGIVASQDHDGRKMLENPDLTIRIG